MWSAALRAYIGEVTVMAAIVTSMLFLPLGALLAGLLFLADISFEAFLTFNGALNTFQGLLAWWALGFVPASVYAVFVMPWSARGS